MKTSSNVKISMNFVPGRTKSRILKATITPGVAEALLKAYNTRNRSLTDSTVEAYARDMKNGHWNYNGEAIKFSNQNVLTNGQHRLAACVASGVSFVTDILTGMDPDSVMSEDVGKSRSVADVISIQTSQKETLSVPRLRSLRNALLRRRTRLTPSDFLDLKKAFPAVDDVNAVLTMRTGLGRAPVAAAIVIAAQAYPEIMESVARVLAGEAKTNAERLLHRYVFVSNTIEPEDVTTMKVLHALFLQLTSPQSQAKRLLSKSASPVSSSLAFFMSKIDSAAPNNVYAKAYMADARQVTANTDTLTTAMMQRTQAAISQRAGA